MKRYAALAMLIPAAMAIGPMSGAPASSEENKTALPAPPPSGTIGFVVSYFNYPVVFEPAACPKGTALKLKDAWLAQQSPEERERLSRKENEAEFTRAWQASASGPNGTNLCTNPEMFDQPMLRTVESKTAWGLDLDGDAGGKKRSGDTCAHDNFTSPQGDQGIDNQVYRAMGCTLEWRGVDGVSNDQEVGLKQFHASGEWTQVILLRGVDSMVRDDSVEVIYGNTPDRPVVDSKGKFLPGMSFGISDKPPRHRNVLKGRIINSVLTTTPQDIVLAQTWGQGGVRDIRGNRTKYDFRKGRLRLTFQSDGSVTGFVGGYQPLWDIFQSASLGGIGSSLTAGIDCAAYLKTLRHNADGLRDPKTGQCKGISTAMRLTAVPAFITDVPEPTRTAAR
jgi:hypothetical protein